jgi:hypothetical protein
VNDVLTLFVLLPQQGNGATEDCCSKCWRGFQKQKDGVHCAPAVQAPPAAVKPIAPLEEEAPTPMDVDICSPVTNEIEEKPSVAATTPKKKKKASYKNMMKGMLKSNSPEKDIEQEKESLRKVTGGGTFSKIDKI